MASKLRTKPAAEWVDDIVGVVILIAEIWANLTYDILLSGAFVGCRSCRVILLDRLTLLNTDGVAPLAR